MELKIDKQAKGTRIIVGEQAKQRRRVLNQMIEVVEDEGFSEIILPSVEKTEIYVDKAGKEILNQMYTFEDKGGRDLCLRPEGTATVQLVANKYYPQEKDVKFWYFEKCWRYERPQKGRYREFFQFGVEWLNPSRDVTEDLIKLAETMIGKVTTNYVVSRTVKRGLDYYVEDGFEISVPTLGAQKQVLGGGTYKEGIGFGIGFDRLLLV